MQNVTISQNEYLELLRYKEIVTVLEELVHGPAFKQEFIDRVRAAEKRIKEGEKASFKSVEEIDEYIDEMEE